MSKLLVSKLKLTAMVFVLLGQGLAFADSVVDPVADPSRSIEAELLQIQHQRLYLSKGEESLVLPGCPLLVLCGGETVLRGVVEQAFEGIAISSRIASLEAMAITNDCQFRILPARIDSTGPILIGTDIPKQSPLSQLVMSADSLTARVLRFYKNRTELLLDYRSGMLDGYLSYRSGHVGRRRHRVESMTAPYIAFLSPHPARSFNQSGNLTTSMYYRFDSDNLDNYFDGELLRPRYSLFEITEEPNRAYPLDTEKGDKLFRLLQYRPTRLRLFIQDKSLRPLADYFADLLSRNQCRVRPHSNAANSDLLLGWYYRPDSSTALHNSSFMHNLAADTSAGRPLNESINLLSRLLASASNESDDTRRRYLLSRAETTLAHDIGIFPLFSPTIFLTTDENIFGTALRADGRIDLAAMRRLILHRAEATLK